MRKVLIIVGLLCILVNPLVPNADAQHGEWVIDGDTVYVDDENLYISATPHTLNGDGWVEFELETKSYDGDIDVVWGFDIPTCTPHTPQIWRNYSHELIGYHYVDRVGSMDIYNVVSWVNLGIENYHLYEVDHGSINNTYLINVTYNISYTFIVAFDSYVEFGDGDDYRLTGHYDNLESYIYYETFFDWQSWDTDFNVVPYDFGGMNTWYLLTEIPIVHDYRYRVRAWIDIPFNTEGKYWWVMKPHDKTIPESISDGTFYYLDPWWSSNWDYYKTITVCDKLDDYQTKLVVDYDVDVGGNVSCEGHCQTDFDDVRFVYNNATELPYWIENYTASIQATFWVNNSGNYSSFEMYYGNGVIGNASDGFTTFDVFDDFEDALQGDWTTVTGTPDYASANAGYESAQGWEGDANGVSHDASKISTTISNTIAIQCRLYRPNGHGSVFHFTRVTDWLSYVQIGRGVTNNIEYYTGGGHVDTGSDAPQNTWFYLEVRDIDLTGHTFDLVMDDVVIADDVGMWNSNAGNNEFYVLCVKNYDLYMDNYIVRKWNSIEPTWCGFGSEQSRPVTPVISNEYPSNGSIYVCPTSAELGITVSDPNGDVMNITFYSNLSGVWDYFYLGTINRTLVDVGNGTYFINPIYFTRYNHVYYWNVTVTDGTHWTNSSVFSFTTSATPCGGGGGGLLIGSSIGIVGICGLLGAVGLYKYNKRRKEYE